MAENRETMRAMAELRVRVSAAVDAATDDLVRSWLYAWTQIVPEWQAAVDELANMRADGRWPTVAQINRAERAQRALEATYAGLIALGDQAGVTITRGLNEVVQAAMGQVDVIATQLPPGDARLGISLVHADPRQIEQIVIRTQEQVTKILFPLAGDSYDIIRSTLIGGVALGKNPRVVAREMVRGIEIGFNQALTRAMVIARTEMLDAHREAARMHDLANADVLEGWTWLATLDTSTCRSCLAQHGTVHDLHEPGPIDHQCGRCARMTKAKSWRDLGFDIDEPASVVPSSRDWFDSLDEIDQRKVLGPKAYKAWAAGEYPMDQWSTRRVNPGWRDSMVPSRPPAVA